jgi:dTMP kinase
VPIDVASERILAGRPKLKYYEAGMDLNLSNDLYESYRIFQSRIIDQYESMIQSERFLPIDGTSGIEEQQQLVRKKIAEIIPQGKGRIMKKQVLKDA